MSASLRLTLAQINPVLGDIDGNLSAISKICLQDGAQSHLTVFPEMALCGYPPEDLVLKPVFTEKILDALRLLATRSKGRTGLWLVPAPIRHGGKVYNAAHLIGYGRIITSRLKHHLPNYGVFDEARVFSPGPLPAPLEIDGHKIGLMICEDMWHADVAGYLKKMGAELLIAVNASPFESGKEGQRVSIARERTQDTGVPLVYVNIVGGQDDLVFDGNSFMLEADGELAWQAPAFRDSVTALSLAKTARDVWSLSPPPATERPAPAGIPQDKKEDLHHQTEALYRALCLGLQDYVKKNGFPGVLLGLSGGIDSALVAALAVDALGPARVRAVMMPSPFTSEESVRDAQILSRTLKITLETLPIHNPAQSFENLLRPLAAPDAPSTTYENIQSRCRGVLLMGLSNATGWLVLSTGNKSEIAVGYATLYGDMCGGFNPLKDVYKTQVYALARWRNAHKSPDGCLGPAGPIIHDNVLEKAPTAELKPGQTDQDTLPPYESLDAILHALIEQDLSLEQTAAQGHDPAVVRKVARMVDAAEYKRRQAPPGPKITAKAFGKERRYPITHRFREDKD